MSFFTGRYYVLIYFILLTLGLNAQEEIDAEEFENTARYTLIEASYNAVVPQQSYGRFLDPWHHGFRFAVYRSFYNNPRFLWGITVQSYTIERLSNTLEFTNNFEVFDVSLNTASKSVVASASFRYFPEISFSIVEPFVDINLGMNNIYTRTKETVVGSEESTADLHEYDAAMAYSAGFGIQLNFKDTVAAHILASYAGGSTADYYIVEDEVDPEPWFNFEKRTTQLTYTNIFIGLSFDF